MKKTLIILAMCTQTGSYEHLLILEPHELITMGEEANSDGTKYVEYLDSGIPTSGYFLEAVTITQEIKADIHNTFEFNAP